MYSSMISAASHLMECTPGPLETFIPPDLFPDVLLVHDLDNITSRRPANANFYENRGKCKTDVPVRYVRVRPKPAASIPSGSGPWSKTKPERKNAEADGPPHAPLRIAHLYLSAVNKIESGNHSVVYRAALRLRLDSNPYARADHEEGDAPGWRTVSVAAKTAVGQCGAHQMLRTESHAYSSFSCELMADTIKVAKGGRPKAESEDADVAYKAEDADEHKGESESEDGNSLADEVSQSTTEGVGQYLPAVVPKFFGYYSAVDEDEHPIAWCHLECGEDDKCHVNWPTHLLIEECGTTLNSHELPCLQRYARRSGRAHSRTARTRAHIRFLLPGKSASRSSGGSRTMG